MKLRLRLFIILLILSTFPAIYLISKLEEYNISDVKKFLLSSIAIIIASVFLMLHWFYLYVATPLCELKEATKKIKNENLDYALELDAHDEIAEIVRDFEEMRINLKTSYEQKIQDDINTKELISNISHDLKTPITAIKGYVEGIMDGVASKGDKLDKYIRTIYNKSNDLDRLIDELTFYTQIDSNRIPYNYKIISALDFFEDCAKEIALEMENKNVSFFTDYNIEKDVFIVADSEQLKRVINNIISNSIKYMDKKDARININLIDEIDFIKIEIEDNGIGISQKDLPHIFDRFYRADVSRASNTGGSGIGLSIVRKIVEDHGGRVFAKSEISSGTKIIIVFRKYHNRGFDE